MGADENAVVELNLAVRGAERPKPDARFPFVDGGGQ
jgi:hypothetical protein